LAGTEVATTAPAEVVKPQTKVVSVKTFIYNNMKSIEEALPRVGLTSEAVARTALSQIYKNPQLGACDQISIMRAIIEAASLGLSFALGRAYLVPFNNKTKDLVTGRESWRMEATFMPGFQGLVDLVRRSAEVKTVVAQAVYKGDEFDYSTNLEDDTLHFKKVADDNSEKNLTHAFCIIRFLNGGYQWVVLDRAKLDKIRAQSKAGDGPSSPWVKWFEEMCIKSAVKRCTKLCPASIELARAIELDNAAEMGERQNLAFDGKLLGEPEHPQLGSGEAAPPLSATQSVSQQAAATLKKARESAPETPAEEEPAEAPKRDSTPPAGKPGPGRPPLPVCPGLEGESGCPDGHKLRSPVEKELNLCSSCQRRQTEAIREENGTAPEPRGEEPTSVAPAESPEDATAAIYKLALRVRANFLIDCDNSLSRAEVMLSELSGGKVQKFDLLADYIIEHPEFIPKLQEAMK
jgi:recombination protein RecT